MTTRASGSNLTPRVRRGFDRGVGRHPGCLRQPIDFLPTPACYRSLDGRLCDLPNWAQTREFRRARPARRPIPAALPRLLSRRVAARGTRASRIPSSRIGLCSLQQGCVPSSTRPTEPFRAQRPAPRGRRPGLKRGTRRLGILPGGGSCLRSRFGQHRPTELLSRPVPKTPAREAPADPRKVPAFLDAHVREAEGIRLLDAGLRGEGAQGRLNRAPP